MRSVLQLRELEERLRQQLYATHKIVDKTKTKTMEHGVIVENWMHLVARTAERSLTDELPDEIVKNDGRPCELLFKPEM